MLAILEQATAWFVAVAVKADHEKVSWAGF